VHVNVQVVDPEWVAAYELDGNRAPLGWARIIVLMAVAMKVFNIEDLDVFVHRDRGFGRWWTSMLLVYQCGSMRADREGEMYCWEDGDEEGDDSC